MERRFVIPQSSCGIPTSARAFSFNITVVPLFGVPFNYLKLWPGDNGVPAVTLMESPDQRVRATAVIVGAGSDGGVKAQASTSVHLVIDINGYFVPETDPTALAFYPLPPCRVVDTRESWGALGLPHMSAGSTRTFPVLSSSCAIPATARAYSFNYTAQPRSGYLGFLATWPTGTAWAGVSTLNAWTGATTANAVVVPAGAGGAIDLLVTDDTDIIIDVNGYFAPATAPNPLSLCAVQPCQAVNTTITDPPTLQGARSFVIATKCSVPQSAAAFVLNARIDPVTQTGYLSLWPSGQSQPIVSTLNAFDGTVTSNAAIVPSGAGSVSAYVSSPADLFLDVYGYSGPPGGGGGPTYTLITSVNPPGAGSVTPACSSGCSYSARSNVSISAVPTAGYYFLGYTGDLTGASPQTLTMNSSKAVTAVFGVGTTPMAAFRSCVENSSSPTCPLPASGSPYTVTQPIVIRRSNVTVTGTSPDRAQTRITRDPAYTGPLVVVGESIPVTGVKVQNLTFCGNNNLYDASRYVINPYSSRVCPTRLPSQPTACDTNRNTGAAQMCVDLAIANAATSYPDHPFAYLGPYAVTLSNLALQDAPGHAIAIYPTAPAIANDVFIMNTDISGSAVTGILSGVNSNTNYGDAKICDANPAFANDRNVLLPRNIRMESNTFYNNNTARSAWWRGGSH